LGKGGFRMMKENNIGTNKNAKIFGAIIGNFTG
jgi:hypothetical protein